MAIAARTSRAPAATVSTARALSLEEAAASCRATAVTAAGTTTSVSRTSAGAAAVRNVHTTATARGPASTACGADARHLMGSAPNVPTTASAHRTSATPPLIDALTARTRRLAMGAATAVPISSAY